MSTFSKSDVVWITGASTGIGRGLALSYAAEGYKVAVSARSIEKLRELEASSANIKAYPLDVTDTAATAATVAAIEAGSGPIGLAILNAGVWQPMSGSNYDPGKAKTSMEVNYFGVTNALAPLLRVMLERGRGHIGIVSSVAGYRGLPKGAAYAPSKAALINLAEGLHPELKTKGVTLTIINPGFVATPMTEPNRFPMPFIVSTEYAVEKIRQGLARGKFEIAFPPPTVVWLKTMRLLPYWLYFAISNWVTGQTSKREQPPTASG